MTIKCEDCKYVKKILIEHTTQKGKEYVNSIECELGIVPEECKARIIGNIFIQNAQQAYSANCIMIYPFLARSHWRNNYWDDWQMSLPGSIRVYWWFIILPFFEVVGPFPSLSFDWIPAQEPHDLP
jgi:hypothetical protein